MNLIQKCTLLVCITLFHHNHPMVIPVAAAAAKAVGVKVFVVAASTLPATLPAAIPAAVVTATTTATVVVPVAKTAFGIATVLKGAGAAASFGGLLLAAKKLLGASTQPQVAPVNTMSTLASDDTNDGDRTTPALINIPRPQEDTKVRKGVRKKREKDPSMPSRNPGQELDNIEIYIEDLFKKENIEELKEIKKEINKRFPRNKLVRDVRERVDDMLKDINEKLERLEKEARKRAQWEKDEQERMRKSQREPENKTVPEPKQPENVNKEKIDTPPTPQPSSTQPRDTTNASTPPPPPADKPSTIIEQTPDDNSSIGGLALAWASLSTKSTNDNDSRDDDDRREAAPARRIPRNNGRAERATPPITTAPSPVGIVLPNSTTAVTDVNAASSTANHAQSYPTTDLPATGANTSSASSNMVDGDISLDGIMFTLDPANSALSSQKTGEYEFNTLLLDLVSTARTEDPIDPELRAALDTIFVNLSNSYDPLDPQLYATALEQGLALVAQRKEFAQQLVQARKERREELIAFTNGQMNIFPQDTKALYIFCQAFVERLSYVKDRVYDLGHFVAQVTELAGDTMVQVVIFNKQRADNPLVMPPVDPNAKLFKLIGSCSRQGIRDWCKKVGQLTPEQTMDLKGRVAADMLFGLLAQKAIGAGIRLARTGSQLHLDGQLGQSIEKVVQSVSSKVKNVLPAAEEVVAVTAEGVPVRIANAAEETMSFQDAAQKIGGAAQKAEGLLVSVAEQAVVKNLADSFVVTARQDIPRLRHLFDGKFKGFGPFANKFLKFDYEHILGMDLKFTRRGIPDIGGFHHDFMGIIEKSGIFEFANKKILKNGLCSVELRYLGNKVKDITFFPSHWSQEQVIEKIIESCENFVKSGVPLSEIPGGKYLIESTAAEGIVIRMFITKNGLVTSAYPILK